MAIRGQRLRRLELPQRPGDLRVDGPAYAVCPLNDATKAHKSGSTVPLKLQLCDAAWTNLSDPAVVVHASSVYQADSSAVADIVPDAGNANPDQDFRYDADLGGYIYNLKTTGFGLGTWVVTFTVNGEVRPQLLRDLRRPVAP